MIRRCWWSCCCVTLVGLIVSCSGKKVHVNEDTDLSIEDTLTTIVEPLQEPDIEEVAVPTRADELFDDFIWNFSSDEKLQRRRVRFPLQVVTTEGNELVQRDDWEFDGLFAYQPNYTLIFDNEADLDLEGDTSLSSAEVEWLYLDSKMQQHYFFNRDKGAWMLDSIRISPLLTEDGDFLSFYSHFANDSIYQLEHITNPIEFVTLDPDDEFSILETTMGVSQWFAFKPELPVDKLTNINYGQANDDHSRTKILKVNGFEDGTSIILYFRKRGEEWEMFKFEDTSI
ncbi:MAG: DUF4348 domain-containing protein [Bacteroidaceae bacterium]|nr:DUF4348 domain-containing protein [Bacteroidaceae bacterium]